MKMNNNHSIIYMDTYFARQKPVLAQKVDAFLPENSGKRKSLKNVFGNLVSIKFNIQAM